MHLYLEITTLKNVWQLQLESGCAVTRRRQWQTTPVLLPGKSHGWRSLVGCSPWGRKESDRTVRLHFHFSLSCSGEGNGNPLQCSCLENPREGGAWWAAVYGVAQSRTRLKRLSSSSSSAFTKFGLKEFIAYVKHSVVHLLWKTVISVLGLKTTIRLRVLQGTRDQYPICTYRWEKERWILPAETIIL